MRICPTFPSYIACIVGNRERACNLSMSASSKPLNLDPRMIFEAALAVVESDDSCARTAAVALLDRVRPLRSRTESAHSQKERALNDAAEALAKLWKK
jgi:hypothetical protein